MTITNKTLTVADTEYSVALNQGTAMVTFQCRTAFAIRYAFVTGKVATPTAPYMTLKADSVISLPLATKQETLYLGTDEAGVVVEVIESQ